MNQKLFLSLASLFIVVSASAQIQQPSVPSVGTTYLSTVTWTKNSTEDFKIYDQNGNTLTNIKELGVLNTDTLLVLHKPSRTIVLLPDFDSKSNNIEYNGSILKRKVSTNFYITNPYSFKTYVDDISYTSEFSNIDGSYVAYISALNKTYLLDDIRKFKSWGAKDIIDLGEAPENTFWYRDIQNNTYGIIKEGKPINYDLITSNFKENDLFVTYDSRPKYILKNYKNSSSFKFKPIFLDNSTVKTTGCIKGDCFNGWGTREYDNGKYEGFWVNGKRQGYGLYDWTDAGNYIGNWTDNKMTGYGVYIAKNDDNFIGEYKDGKLHGIGLTVKDKKWTQGIYDNGTLKTNYNFYSTGNETGCTAGDCQNKYGRMKWSNGDSFTGFFKNGNLHMGTYTFANGDKYSGQFNSSNQYHGMGRFFFKDGAYYGGEWKNGKYHGRGYYQSKNYEKQIGEWFEGNLAKSEN